MTNQRPKAKSEKKMPSSNPHGLGNRRWLFCQEVVVDENATAAYLRAGYKQTASAEHNASRLMGNDKVKAALIDLRAAKAERSKLKADDVLARWIAIADADPNELIELRRTCCRYCHGEQFHYQRTSGEMEQAKAGWEVLSQKASAAGTPIAPFDPAGGEGYDVRKPPHHDCPECFGEGVAIPFPKDTRHLSEGARWLFAGVKVTKDGIEIKMHDQMAALLNIAKHLGMFVKKVEYSSKGGGAIPITIVGIEIVDPEFEPKDDHEALL